MRDDVTVRAKHQHVKGHDGTEIYYESVGEGLPLFLIDGIGCYGYVWKYIRQYFGSTNRIIHMHYRGHGKSAVPVDENNLTIQDLCQDIATVMEHEGIDGAVMVGHSMGVQVILEFGHLFPEKTLGLVPICGSYGRPLSTFNGSDIAEKYLLPLLYGPMVLTPWVFTPIWKWGMRTPLALAIALRTEANRHLINVEDFKPYFKDISRVPIKIFVKMLDHAAKHDAEPNLPNIQCPTLIVAGEHDGFTPARLSAHMCEAMPNAELITLPHTTHTAPLEMPDLLNLRLEKWLRRHFDFVPADEMGTATKLRAVSS